MAFTPENQAELARLEQEFAAAGGRGIELADRIDQLRTLRDTAPMLLVYGDPATGFTFLGPIVANDHHVEEFTETNLRDTSWWYVPLQPAPLPDQVHEFTLRIIEPDADGDQVRAVLHDAVTLLIDALDAAVITIDETHNTAP